MDSRSAGSCRCTKGARNIEAGHVSSLRLYVIGFQKAAAATLSSAERTRAAARLPSRQSCRHGGMCGSLDPALSPLTLLAPFGSKLRQTGGLRLGQGRRKIRTGTQVSINLTGL